MMEKVGNGMLCDCRAKLSIIFQVMLFPSKD